MQASGRPVGQSFADAGRSAERLVETIRALGSCAVAFSGGVDSAVVAKAAQLALGDRAIAVTGASASLAAGELDIARSVAAQIGIRHEVLETEEFQNEQYTQNHSDRCYHCKTELYSQLGRHLDQWRVAVVVNGANRDDLGDYRPGLRAASEHEVRSPLAECGFSKAHVRQLARFWELPVWDKPATPCLSSRVAYGEPVTRQRLEMIDQAERWLRAEGFSEVRVRCHRGDLARVEVAENEVSRLTEQPTRSRMSHEFRRLGFQWVTVDLDGFRSGSMNALVSIDELWKR